MIGCEIKIVRLLMVALFQVGVNRTYSYDPSVCVCVCVCARVCDKIETNPSNSPPQGKLRSQHLSFIHCRTQYGQSSFLPNTVQHWNYLPESTVPASTPDSFIERCFLVAVSSLARILGECSTIYSPPAILFLKWRLACTH